MFRARAESSEVLGTTTGPPTLTALTGLRGLLLFPVLAAHSREYMQDVLPATLVLDNQLRSAFLAVDVFFILSGFVLSYNYAERFASSGRAEFRGYFVSRFARIYPVYLLTLVLTGLVVGGLGLGGRNLTALGYVSNVFMLQMMPGAQNWNMPSWSVACEVGAYLVFPFLARYLARCTWRTALAAGVALVVLHVVAMNQMFGMHVPVLVNLYYWERLGVGFALGCLAWVVWRGRVRRHGGWDIVLVLAMVMVVTVVHVLRRTPGSYLVVGLLAVLVLALAASAGPIGAAVGRRRLVRLGETSYSVYLVHYPIFLILLEIIPAATVRGTPLPLRMAALAAFFVLPIVVGSLLFRFFEEPARRWVRRRLAPRPDGATSAGQTSLMGRSIVDLPVEAPATEQVGRP